MSDPQPGILADVPAAARYLTLDLRPDADPRPTLISLGRRPVDDGVVFGLGPPLVAALGGQVPGLRPLATHVGPGLAVPSTQVLRAVKRKSARSGFSFILPIVAKSLSTGTPLRSVVSSVVVMLWCSSGGRASGDAAVSGHLCDVLGT